MTVLTFLPILYLGLYTIVESIWQAFPLVLRVRLRGTVVADVHDQQLQAS